MQGSKAAWIANAKRIAIEAEALERKTGTGSKSEEMKHEAAEFTKQRNEAKLATSKRVHGIRLVLSDIQNKIQTGTWQSNSVLRNHLENFESKLTAFKLLMRSEYDTLEETGHILESDIERLTSEFDSWDHPDNEYELGAKDPHVDAEAQKRITERNRVDLERRAYIGAIDRRVYIPLYMFSLHQTYLTRLLCMVSNRSLRWDEKEGGTPGTTNAFCAYGFSISNPTTSLSSNLQKRKLR